jgi:hypothetical protein
VTVAAGALSFGALGHKATAADSDNVGPFEGALQDGTPVLSGVVAAVEGNEMSLQGADPGLRIRVAAGATVWKDKPAKVGDFLAGDHIAVIGEWSGSSEFMARELAPNYFNLAGEIQKVESNLLVTTGGAAEITDETKVLTRDGTLVPVPTAELRSGKSVSVMARRQAGDPEFVAFRVNTG